MHQNQGYVRSHQPLPMHDAAAARRQQWNSLHEAANRPTPHLPSHLLSK
jgi:hypothetical protein